MTPMPRRPPELPNIKGGSQPSNLNTPPNLASATDRGKISQFATKVKEEIEIKDSNSSLRKLERKRHTDLYDLLQLFYVS